jgi:hypothetical protein
MCSKYKGKNGLVFNERHKPPLPIHNFNPIFVCHPQVHPTIMSHTFNIPLILKNIALDYGRDFIFQLLAIPSTRFGVWTLANQSCLYKFKL